MSALTASSAYARQNGKPVVCIWGFGFNDANHPWSAAVCLDVVNWFKGQGVYLIGGVPREWRTGTGGSRSGFGEGNQICMTADTQASVPAGSGLLTLDADGTVCSSDYYLRLTNDGGRMLKGQIALTATRPTQPFITAGGTGLVFSLRAVAML